MTERSFHQKPHWVNPHALEKLYAQGTRALGRVVAMECVGKTEYAVKRGIIRTLRGRNVEQPDHPWANSQNELLYLILAGLTKIYGAPHIKRYHEEHIQKIEKLAEEKRKLIFMINHESNADHYIVTEGFRRAGSNIPDKFLFIKGIRLDSHPVSALFSRSLASVPVASNASMKDATEEQKREYTKMNRRSFVATRRLMGKGWITAVYFEGTRTENGIMQDPEEKVEDYLDKNRDAVVVPITVFDVDKMMGKGMKFPRPAIPSIVFGKPMEVAELFERQKDIPEKEKPRKVLYTVVKEVNNGLPRWRKWKQKAA